MLDTGPSLTGSIDSLSADSLLHLKNTLSYDRPNGLCLVRPRD